MDRLIGEGVGVPYPPIVRGSMNQGKVLFRGVVLGVMMMVWYNSVIQVRLEYLIYHTRWVG